MNGNRRAFFAGCAYATVARLACASVKVASAANTTIDPLARPAVPKLSLGLAAYSYRAALDLKKPTMTLFDFIDLAARFPVDAVELTSYYFADTSADYLTKLKAACKRHQLLISGVPIRTDFCVTDPAKLKSEINHTKAWVERAVALGSETVRIFAGSLPKGATLADTQKQVIEALQTCADYAENRGVTLVLENHGGIVATPEGLLALVKPIRGRGLAVNADTGNFRTADPYADLAKILPYARTIQLKTEMFPAAKPAEEADLPRLIQLIRDAHYDGVVTLEYEAKEDAKTAVPRVLKQLRELIL